MTVVLSFVKTIPEVDLRHTKRFHELHLRPRIVRQGGKQVDVHRDSGPVGFQSKRRVREDGGRFSEDEDTRGLLELGHGCPRTRHVVALGIDRLADPQDECALRLDSPVFEVLAPGG